MKADHIPQGVVICILGGNKMKHEELDVFWQERKGEVPRALTIAGSDSGGGAGIQADLKVFTALGVYGMSALTAITAQNTQGVRRIDTLPPAAVTSQLEACLDDIGADAAKTGMLSSPSIVGAVADTCRRYGLKQLVVDPVMVAKSGDYLLEREARETLREQLLPLAMVVTPNLHEAAVLAEMEVTCLSEMKEAARRIHAAGPKIVVVKGGHLQDQPLDLVYDGSEFRQLKGRRIETENNHGTGCSFSAAITSGLALGLKPLLAIRAAKRLLTWGLKESLDLGSGHGPTNHFYYLLRE